MGGTLTFYNIVSFKKTFFPHISVLTTEAECKLMELRETELGYKLRGYTNTLITEKKTLIPDCLDISWWH